MSDFLDKRDRRVLRRGSWSNVPPHRMEKLQRHAAALGISLQELARRERVEFLASLGDGLLTGSEEKEYKAPMTTLIEDIEANLKYAEKRVKETAAAVAKDPSYEFGTGLLEYQAEFVVFTELLTVAKSLGAITDTDEEKRKSLLTYTERNVYRFAQSPEACTDAVENFRRRAQLAVWAKLSSFGGVLNKVR